VVLASERARQLSHGAEPLVECSNKPAVTSLREIADERVKFREGVHETVREYIAERREQGFM
jgi:DNA-directed RNA polymerase subunit K/omega